MTSQGSALPRNPQDAPLPLVSIVIPCRNEAQFITRCLDSIAANSYPKSSLEVLVVDGMSDDGTRDILTRYSANHPFVRFLDNPNRTTPFAFNIGVKQSKGDLVMIMSAHATYESHAIERSVKYSRDYGAENVGGIWEVMPRNEGVLAQAIVLALSHPFGVGGALYRTGGLKEPIWADTAAYGCYRRTVFDKIGFFNERLTHGQDMEFNLRLQKAGGKTLLAPDIVIQYFARTTPGHFVAHSFRSGQWAILPFCHSDVIPVSPRHLVPLAFVCSLIAFAAAAPFSSSAWQALALLATVYGGAAVFAAFSVARRSGKFGAALLTPLVFVTYHLSYGLGSLLGVLKASVILASRKVGHSSRELDPTI